MNILTTEQKNEIRRLRQENPKVWSWGNLAKTFGVSETRVRVIADKKYAAKQRKARLDYYYRKKRNTGAKRPDGRADEQ